MDRSFRIARAQRVGLVTELTRSGVSDSEDHSYRMGASAAGSTVTRNDSTQTSEVPHAWKVLVFDDQGRDVIAPLLHVNDLRQCGVTLHLSLVAPRQQVPEVPAVYVIAPTQENLARICEDCGGKLYDSFWINFTSPIAPDALQAFAERIAHTGNASAVASVRDLHCNFVSLDDDLFSLNMPLFYSAINDRSVADKMVEEKIQAVASGLLSALATLSCVPIIRAQRGGAAEMVATLLDTRIREELSSRNGMFGDAPSAAAYERPLLVILDRNLDLPVMLHHTWTYQALTHDLLALSLNRVVVPGTKDETTGKTSAPKTYDLNHSDDFWTQNAGQPFPKVAEAVERTLEEYQNEVAEINKSAGSIGDLVGDASLRENLAEKSFGSDTEALAKALEKVPALMKKKRLIDIHTNIATALLDQIKDRGLDGFFQLEDQVLSGAASSIAQNALLSMIRGNAGRPMDKLRMFLIYFLCHPELPSSEITEFRLALEESGCDIRALDYVRGIKALTATLTTAPPTGGEASSKVHASGLEKMMSTVVEHGVKGLAQVATNFNKLILEEDKMLAVARVVNTLMDQKGSSDILERYIYLDPRKPSSDRSRANRTFRQAVVFMVGGGNYLEYQNVREHARGGKHVIYGATDICSAEDFAKQLAGLSGVPAPPTVTPTKGNGGAL